MTPEERKNASHFVATWDGATARLYVNGKPVPADKTFSLQMWLNNNPLTYEGEMAVLDLYNSMQVKPTEGAAGGATAGEASDDLG